MIRPIALSVFLALLATTNVEAQSEGSEPLAVRGCDGFEGSCSEGSERAAVLTGAGVYVEQIGQRNASRIVQRQGSTQSFARIVQDGEDNTAIITQDGESSFADIAQTGMDNDASVAQGGLAHSSASVSQTGVGNQASISQSATFIGHSAVTRQTGNGNAISLTQSGDGNSALLTQEGDDNRMSVDQSGTNNALTWIQTGSGLSGPAVTMDGNDRSLTITQYNMYAPR